MRKKKNDGDRHIARQEYKKALRKLQIELVNLQKHLIECNDKILILLEGRDAAGKDGVIKRIVQHLSPRESRVVALGRPSDRERGSWYFQRFVPHLPGPQEFVLFNRSWYNRAGVEHVMGFCTDAEYEHFLATVVYFEQMLVDSGIRLLKYYLDISCEEQRKRLEARKTDPLKQWKISPIDRKALSYWEAYSKARNQMLARTHHPSVPWIVVRANNKRVARLNLIRDLLARLPYAGKKASRLIPDPNIVFEFEHAALEQGLIAP